MIHPKDWRAPSGKFYPLTTEVAERLDITGEMLTRYAPRIQCPDPEYQIEEMLAFANQGWTMCWAIHRGDPIIVLGIPVFTRQRVTPITFMIAG